MTIPYTEVLARFLAKRRLAPYTVPGRLEGRVEAQWLEEVGTAEAAVQELRVAGFAIIVPVAWPADLNDLYLRIRAHLSFNTLDPDNWECHVCGGRAISQREIIHAPDCVVTLVAALIDQYMLKGVP